MFQGLPATWVPGRPGSEMQSGQVEQAVELDEVDAHGGSLAPNRSDRIMKDIENELYNCPICHDTITTDISEIWACHCCYQAYHPGCIYNWAKSSTRLPHIEPWPCPTCKQSHASYPEPSCWCRKRNMSMLAITAGSCGYPCSKEHRCGTRTNCESYKCLLKCHPGPCIKKECTDKCGEERPSAPVAPQPTLQYSGVLNNNTYVPPEGESIRNIADIRRENGNRNGTNSFGAHPRRDYRFLGVIHRGYSTDYLLYDLCVIFPVLIGFNSLVLFWSKTRLSRYTMPLVYQKFTESKLRNFEQTFCILFAIILFGVNIIFWGSAILRISHCLKVKLGLSTSLVEWTSPDLPWRRIKIAASKLVSLLMWIVFFILTIFIPMVFIIGPGHFWKYKMDGTCNGFDTRIQLSQPYAQYFGLENTTLSRMRYTSSHYTQTPGRYTYPSSDDYESYPSGIDLFDITKVNATTSSNNSSTTLKPFNEYWRIMGIYGDKPLHLDFDLEHHSWRMSKGNIVIDPENPSSSFYPGSLYKKLLPHHFSNPDLTKDLTPNFETTIQNLTQVRNGTWTLTHAKGQDTQFPELGLVIPKWWLFDKHCAYQSFMRVFRENIGAGGRNEDGIFRNWERDSVREEVMRTVSYGYGGGSGLEVCARRNEYTWGTKGVEEREEGLGEDLLVPLGLMAVVRKRMRDEQKRVDFCPWPEH
ncbi:f3977661-a282-47cf-8e08-448f0e779779 [Sclerotinia trifoliorum]|uniref:F3977661-a282-47cf-8e08-448f0e779779 n=1 Tax=Sclerotinia trifoliorum TaxID=28548 RepID=A0A8H2W391_9HELO|nr:f3977661-a282-47cf-8e08-448f0e779779 [Sclerotinia trifoliorum]